MSQQYKNLKSTIQPKVYTNKASRQWRTIGGKIQDRIENTILHLGRKPVLKEIPRTLSQPTMPLLKVNKNTISAPFHIENSSQSSRNSLSTKEKILPAITISPMDQASLYAWMECTVVQACSDFLRAQKTSLDIGLLRKEVKKWENKKIRLSTGEIKNCDRVIEFMFGMEIQCRLVEGNMKNLHFSGPAALNPANAISAWKSTIPSFSPRTYCIPDYLILEHFHVLEKILGLFGPVYYDVEKFENRQSELIRCIMQSNDDESYLLSMKRLATLQGEREKAEEELLKEVGLLTIGEEE